MNARNPKFLLSTAAAALGLMACGTQPARADHCSSPRSSYDYGGNGYLYYAGDGYSGYGNSDYDDGYRGSSYGYRGEYRYGHSEYVRHRNYGSRYQSYAPSRHYDSRRYSGHHVRSSRSLHFRSSRRQGHHRSSRGNGHQRHSRRGSFFRRPSRRHHR